MAGVTLYGIPNCDTVKKARAWLAGQGVAVVFHDFKKQGVPADRLLKLPEKLDDKEAMVAVGFGTSKSVTVTGTTRSGNERSVTVSGAASRRT